jgi:hypothetical protein
MSEAQPPPPPTHHVSGYSIGTYSHREGGRGGDGTTQKVRGATIHKAGKKSVSPIYKL